MVRTEAVWALVVICEENEVNVKAASRECKPTLKRCFADIELSVKASAMSKFLLERIKEWRTGGNR